MPSTPALRSHGFAKTSFTHLISLYFGGDSSVVNDLWGQKVKLDVGVRYFGTTTNKSSAFHVGCCSITLWEIDVVSEMIVILIRQAYLQEMPLVWCDLPGSPIKHLMSHFLWVTIIKTVRNSSIYCVNASCSLERGSAAGWYVPYTAVCPVKIV